MIHMISCSTPPSYDSYDPCVGPHPFDIDSLGDSMLLSLAEAAYATIQSSSDDSTPNEQHLVASYPYSLPSWLSSPP